MENKQKMKKRTLLQNTKFKEVPKTASRSPEKV